MMNNRYKGKYFSIMGDSVSTFGGYIPSGYATFYSYASRYETGINSPKETWWGQVLAHFGGELLVNNSWSGSYACKAPMCEIESYGCSDARAYGLDADGILPDHIFVYIGTNDRGAGFPLTSEDKSDLSVIENAYLEMLRKMKTKYPEAEIWCFTFPVTACAYDPDFRFPEMWRGVPMTAYSALIRDIAARMGCHIVELEDRGEGGSCDTIDGLHPSYNGMKWLADRVIAAMEQSTVADHGQNG